MLPLLALLACSDPEAPPEPAPDAPAEAAPEAPAPAARTVEGPWAGGDYVAVAASADGAVHAIWVEEDVLLWTSAPAAGAPFAAPERVADQVVAGDGGQALPAIAIGADGPVLAFARAERPHLATRGEQGWTVSPLSTARVGAGLLLDLALVDGEPLVAWLDTRRDPERHLSDVYAWWQGSEHLVWGDAGDGVCMCCRPAAGVVDGRPAVAFRDADGARREVRLLAWEEGAWRDRGEVTRGGWAPGGCPADGPILADGAVWVSDARDGTRRIYRDDRAVDAGGAGAVQPRAVDGRAFHVEAEPGALRLVSDGTVPATSGGRLEPGDPIRVGDEIWIPWQGKSAAVAALR